MKTILHIFIPASLLFITAIAKAELSETFEPYEDYTHVESPVFDEQSQYSWVGMAHVEELTKEVVSSAGYPIQKSDNLHQKALSALGAAFVENPAPSAPSPYAQVEYLQEVSITEDNLVTDEIQDVQIALATGLPLEDNPDFVRLNLYCLPKNGSQPAWIHVGKARLGTYMRVNLAFDYNNQSCRVSVDGTPCMSEQGFLLPDCKDGTSVGAWYQLGTKAFSNRKEKVSSVQFIGLSTKWDEIKITEENYSDHAPFPTSEELRVNLSANGISPAETPHWLNVSLNDLNRWAIDTQIDTSTITLDKSGHTVKEKLELGYDPLDGKIFAPTNMSYSLTQSGQERIELTIPKAADAPDLRYHILATGTHDNGTEFSQRLSATSQTLDNATTISGELPPSPPRVLFFQLEAERTTP